MTTPLTSAQLTNLSNILNNSGMTSDQDVALYYQTLASYGYSARIALDQTEMQVDDRLVPLEPGMAVTAEIKTGSRHIIEYLLSPLLRHRQMALRER